MLLPHTYVTQMHQISSKANTGGWHAMLDLLHNQFYARFEDIKLMRPQQDCISMEYNLTIASTDTNTLEGFVGARSDPTKKVSDADGLNPCLTLYPQILVKNRIWQLLFFLNIEVFLMGKSINNTWKWSILGPEKRLWTQSVYSYVCKKHPTVKWVARNIVKNRCVQEKNSSVKYV